MEKQCSWARPGRRGVGLRGRTGDEAFAENLCLLMFEDPSLYDPGVGEGSYSPPSS